MRTFYILDAALRACGDYLIKTPCDLLGEHGYSRWQVRRQPWGDQVDLPGLCSGPVVYGLNTWPHQVYA